MEGLYLHRRCDVLSLVLFGASTATWMNRFTNQKVGLRNRKQASGDRVRSLCPSTGSATQERAPVRIDGESFAKGRLHRMMTFPPNYIMYENPSLSELHDSGPSSTINSP